MKSERELIRRIAALAREIAPAPARSAVVKGIGDDCAVLRLGPGSDTLITTDLFVEGVHFRKDLYGWETLGDMCLTRGLSDIAAMGGEPVAAFLSLALPPGFSPRDVRRFMAGFLTLAREYGVVLAGGDTGSSNGGFLADVIVLGRVPTGKAVLRSGSKPGDALYVSGVLGAALGESVFAPTKPLKFRGPIRWSWPGGDFDGPPRIAVGGKIRGLASAMIDVSDGLSTDLSHLCEESGVGAIVYEPEIPRLRPDVPVKNDPMLERALHGGEDYELLFTAPRNKKVPSEITGVPITRIGEITGDTGKMFLVDEHGRMKRLEPKGWEHFTAHGRPKPASRAGKRGKR